jgi:hypothetical protein
MHSYLALGSAVIAVTVITHTIGLVGLTQAMNSLVRWFRLHRRGFGKIVAMVTTVLGLFAIHTVEVWTWAVVYAWSGALPDFGTALYFSAVTFSTLGYGDVLLPTESRLLGALEGVNGFLLIGWSTAYLVAASTHYGPFRTGEHF